MSNTQSAISMDKSQPTNALFISRKAEKGFDFGKILLIFKVTLNPADVGQYNSAIIACTGKGRLMELIDGIPFDYDTAFTVRDEYPSIQFDKGFYIHPDQVIDGRKFDKIEVIGFYTEPCPDGIDTIVIESDFKGV